MVSDPIFRNGTSSIDLYPLETEEQYKRIAELICDELSGEIIEAFEGPGFDFTKLRLNGEEIKIAFSAIEGVYVEGNEKPLLLVKVFVEELLSGG